MYVIAPSAAPMNGWARYQGAQLRLNSRLPRYQVAERMQ